MSFERPKPVRKEDAPGSEGELAYVADGLKAKVMARGLEREVARLTKAANDNESIANDNEAVPEFGSDELRGVVHEVMQKDREAA